MDSVLWRVLFKEKDTNNLLVLPSDQGSWSITGDGASPGMLCHGSSVSQGGETQFTKKTKPKPTQITEVPETSAF